MLGGCMQETLAPVTQAGWSARDRQLMSNLPYAQATIPEEFRRHIVSYTRKEVPGTIVVDSSNKFLYYVLPKGQAIRYGITRKPGVASPRSAARKSGHRGHRPPANTRGLGPSRPS